MDLTIKDVAAITGFHENTVRQLARDGKIPAYRIGHEWRIRRGDFEAMRQGTAA